MPDLERRFTIRANDFVNAGEVSLEIQSILKHIGFDSSLIRRISVCAYESEMNVVMHGGDGEALLRVSPKSVALVFTDQGKGIGDIDLAFEPGYSTANLKHREMGFGAGMGLPNIKNSADTLEIHSEEGQGTTLTIGFKLEGGFD